MIRIAKVKLQPETDTNNPDQERWRRLRELRLADEASLTIGVLLTVEMTDEKRLCVYAFTGAQGMPVYHGAGEEYRECEKVVCYTFSKDGWIYFLYP